MNNRTPSPRFIGRVVRAPHPNDQYLFATVQALVASDPANGRWDSSTQAVASRFPSKGCVHWHDADYAGLASEGRLVSFEVDPGVDRPERSERFQLQSPAEAWEVIDLRAWTSDVEVQRALTSTAGIMLNPEPLSPRALVWLPSGVCVGPFRLKRGETSELFLVDGAVAGSDLTRVPSWRPGPHDIDDVFIGGYRRYFIGPSSAFVSNGRPQNWATDEQVARKVLDALRRMDASAIDRVGREHAVTVTTKIFESYLECVEAGRFGDRVPDVERARADRLRALQDAVATDETLLEEVVSMLHSAPTTQRQLEDRAIAAVSALVEARRAELEPALRSAQSELEQVRGEIIEQRGVLTAINAEIEQKQSELDAAVAGYEQALAERLAALVSRTESAFAELAVVQAMGRVLDRSASASSHLAAPRSLVPQPAAAVGGGRGDAAPSPRSDVGAVGPEVIEAGKIAMALGRAAREADVTRAAMLAVHGALAAGLAPVIDGANAYALLRAYGRVIAGGRVHWVPIGAANLEPADLLGRRDPASSRFVPAGSGLLDVIADAIDHDQLHLVVLDGFNRAPAESYLLPILQSAAATRAGDDTRALPLANPGALAEDDQYRRFARLGWPPNVLIACIPVDGPATLPVAEAVLSHCAVVRATPKSDIEDLDGDAASAESGATVVTELSALAWRDYSSAMPAIDGDVREALIARAKEWRLAPKDLRHAEAVWRALRATGDTSTAPDRVATANVLAARAALNAPRGSDALRDAAENSDDLRAIVDAVERLRA